MSIPPVIPVLFRKDQMIFNEKTDTPNKPTLLLIDDSWVQIKLILRKIFPDLVPDASALLKSSWNNNDFLVLENEQWHIICAAGYLRSLQCAKEFSVDIIISDHQLGHSFYDGGSLLKRIYDTFQNRPILCMHTSMKDCSPDQLDFFDTLKSIGANFFIKGEPETLSQILNFLEDFLVKRNENQILKKS